MKIKGFTLIELLVVIGILGLVAAIGTDSFLSLLKGTTKARVLAEVRQNGNYALEVMERMIRNAKSLTEYSGSSITIVGPDDQETIFSCGDSNGDGLNDLASNSASLISDRVKVEDCGSVFSVVPGESGISPAKVTIEFSLSQAEVDVRPEERATVNFRTTVTLRNY